MKKSDFQNIKVKYLLPKKIVFSNGFENANLLVNQRPKCVSFNNYGNTVAQKKGSYIVLDFGRELCGGIRIFTRDAGKDGAKIHLTFGESLSEATSKLGFKNSTNDHSPRDFDCLLATLSDLSFGQTGFRFVKIELCDNEPINIQSVWAFSKGDISRPCGKITTDDNRLNKILKTAEYTLRLNMQNGYIWDGIKRDRLVWSGDLNQEIITSFYCYGENENVYNSLLFLRNEYSVDEWINGIVSYSAWWVINLCDYIRFCKDKSLLKDDEQYARNILKKIDNCIDKNGKMDFGGGEMEFFIDWPTLKSEESVIGVAALIIIAANSFESVFGKNEICNSIKSKLTVYLQKRSTKKQVCALQILAGKDSKSDRETLEKNGVFGFSTFMAYYILSAMAMLGCKDIIETIKTYFGAMLDVGATTFFEDFNLEWTKNSGRIDKLPKEGQFDIHGDFGNCCYKGLRHSLCHGWASGVYAFVIEKIVGLTVNDCYKSITVKPNLCGLKTVSAVIPSKFGKIVIDIDGDNINVIAPDEIKVIIGDE